MTIQSVPKTPLITASSSGIGEAAKLFASNGWNVVATMRTLAADMDLVHLSDVLVTHLDVRDRESIEDWEEALNTGLSPWPDVAVRLERGSVHHGRPEPGAS